MRPLLPPTPHILAFAAAVDATASRMPAITRAVAHHTAHGYSVRYTVNNGSLIALGDAPTASEAVARFVAAATFDTQHSPGSALTPRIPSTDEYLAPLPPSVGKLLVPAIENATCRVFALADWRTDDADNQRPRWAVCQPCPREQWHDLERGEMIVYTELFTFGEGDDEPGATALVTYVGRLLAHDSQRGLFHATVWNVGEGTMHLAADDVQEVWRVILLIPAAQV